MSNVLICYRNRADECTLSGGSYSANLPLNNLKTRDIRQVARSANAQAASTQFVAALTAQRLIRVVALIRSNCSLAATWRVRVYTDSGLTNLVHDSGTVDVWPAWMYAWPALEWEDPRFWDGRPLAEDLSYFSSDLIYPLPTIAVGQYIKVEVFDTANAAGYVEFGRLFVDDGWQPGVNMSFGAGIGHDDMSTIDKTPSGKEFFTEREVRRMTKFELQWMTDGEALGRAFDMQRIAKTVNEVLFVWDPSDSTNLKRRAFMGRLRQLDLIEHPFVNTHHQLYEIQEIL